MTATLAIPQRWLKFHSQREIWHWGRFDGVGAFTTECGLTVPTLHAMPYTGDLLAPVGHCHECARRKDEVRR